MVILLAVSALSALSGLSGCGFTPALGTGGAASGLMGRVRAQDPADPAGFDLVRRLEERLGTPSVAEYDLTYRITTGSEGVAITADGAITRYNLTGAVDWTLVRRADGMLRLRPTSRFGVRAPGPTSPRSRCSCAVIKEAGSPVNR